jgi:hypothetical protein
MTAILGGWRPLLLQNPRSAVGPDRRASQPGHDRIGTAAIAASAWQSAHMSTVDKPSTLLSGPAVEPQNEQRSAMAPLPEHVLGIGAALDTEQLKRFARSSDMVEARAGSISS